MTKLFIRLYALVTGSMLLAFLGVFAFVKFTHTSVHNDTIMHTIAPAMNHVAAEFAATSPGSDARQKLIDDLSKSIGPTLAILPRHVLDETCGINAQKIRALDEGNIIINGDEMGRFAYIALPKEQSVLEFELYGIRSSARNWFTLATRHASKNPPNPNSDLYRIESTENLGLAPIEIARLDYHPTINMHIPFSKHPWFDIKVVTAIPGTNQAMVIQGPGHSPDARWLLIFGCLFLTAIAIAMVLVPMQRKLNIIFESNEAFADGQLHTRTRLTGKGPLDGIGKRFDHMADEIQTAIQRQEDLLRAVSHELKTPLTRLLFLVDEIRYATENPNDQPVEPLIQDAERNVHEVSQLIDELIDYRRICAEDEPPSSMVEIEHILHALQAQFPKLVIQASAVRHTMQGNERLLIRALRNIIANADAYGNETVQLTCTQDQEHITFTVDDDGPGIPMDMRQEVLKPFVRLETSRCREHGGSGLGLAIVARIAEYHHALLDIGDSELGGTKLVLSLPQRQHL